MAEPLHIPIANFAKRGTNATLHGRSVYRSEDVPGHNVFWGWSTWAGNGHKGVGDGVDLMAPVGTEVYAVADGVQTKWRNDATSLEVVYIEWKGGGAVYAHINAAIEGTGVKVAKGQLLGWVRPLRNCASHLHFELWLNGKALAAPKPGDLKAKIAQLVAPSKPEMTVNWNGTELDPAEFTLVDGKLWLPMRRAAELAGFSVAFDATKNRVVITRPAS